jgi:hypothetical protein
VTVATKPKGKTVAKKKAAPAAVVPAVLVAYKGFDKDWKCRGYQYEVGKTYTMAGPVEACERGFHACEHPLDVLKYYAPIGSRYAVVEQAGEIARDSDDSKVASSQLTVKAEIGLPGIIKAGIEYTFKLAKKPTSGYSAHSATSGYSAHSATSGYSAHSATSGDYAHSATSGDYAHSATSGYSAHSATSGDYAHSATSGDYANSATSGDYANSATSGDYAHSATSGDYAHSATSGDYANSATSGYSAQVEAKGKGAVAANAGNGRAKAGADGAIFLVERDGNYNIVAVFASKVGENGIAADTWYVLRGGKPVTP